MCCGTQWWAGCRDTCGGQTQFHPAAERAEDEHSSLSGAPLAAAAAVAAVCLSAAAVIAFRAHRGTPRSADGEDLEESVEALSLTGAKGAYAAGSHKAESAPARDGNKVGEIDV